MNDPDALEELMAKQQIRDAMARYARGIDRRDEALVRSVYHEDSMDSHGFGMDAPGWGLAAMVRRDGNGFPDEWTSTTHLLGQHYIEVDGNIAASSEVYFESTARLRDPDGNEVAADQLRAVPGPVGAARRRLPHHQAHCRLRRRGAHRAGRHQLARP